MPRPNTVTRLSQATKEQQERAVQMLLKKILEGKRAPIDLLVGGFSSWLLNCLLFQLLNVIPEFKLQTDINGKFKEILDLFEGKGVVEIDKILQTDNLREAVLERLPKKYKMEGVKGEKCFKFMKHYRDYGHTIGNKLNAKNLNLASIAEVKWFFSGAKVPKLDNEYLFSTEITELMTRVVSGKETVKQKADLYQKLCHHLKNLHAMSALEIEYKCEVGRKALVEGFTQSVIWCLLKIPMLKRYQLSALYGPSVTVKVAGKKVVLSEKHLETGLPPENFKLLHKELIKLERDSIPWRLYIDRALAMILPIYLLLTVYRLISDQLNQAFLAMIAPAFFDLLGITIRYLYYLTMVRRQFAMYSHNAKYYLESALLKKDVDFSGVFTVKPRHIVEDWQIVQLEISINKEALKTKYLNDKKLLFFLTEMFHRYQIDYTVLKTRGQISVFVFESEVYDRLGLMSYQFWQGCYHQQFSVEFRQLLNLYQWKYRINNELLDPLQAISAISHYWCDEPEQASLHYQIHIPFQIKSTLKKVLQRYSIPFQLDENYSKLMLTITPAKEIYQQLCNFKEKFEQEIKTSKKFESKTLSQKITASTATAAASPKKRRPHRRNRTPTEVISQSPLSENSVGWRSAAGKRYSLANGNIYFMRRSEDYRNKIYVTHLLSPEDFDDPFIYERMRTQLEIGRFAAQRGQQGIFITDKQQCLTVKVLGTNGTGDLRMKAVGFLTSTTGAHLYVVNRVEDHDGNLLNRPIPV